jgi:hypothetical protein
MIVQMIVNCALRGYLFGQVMAGEQSSQIGTITLVTLVAFSDGKPARGRLS